MSAAAEHLFHQGIDRVIAHRHPNRFLQLESPKRPKGFASYQAATLNKGTAAEKGSRECEKSFLTSLARSSPVLD
jgi:hypothetical protein